MGYSPVGWDRENPHEAWVSMCVYVLWGMRLCKDGTGKGEIEGLKSGYS